MTSYRITGKPQMFTVRVSSIQGGLTPSEREVEVSLGGRVLRVLAKQELVNEKAGTLTVSAVGDSADSNYYLVYLGGEVLGSSQRIRIPKDQFPGVKLK